MFPPHLPPPASNLERHRQIERLKVVFISALFGLFAGLSGGAIMIGWISPLTSADGGLFFTRNAAVTREQLEAKAQMKIADEVFTIYQRSTVLGGGRYFSPSDKVAEGVMSVTSGWVVSYIPNFDGHTQSWIAVADNGGLYSIQKSIIDKRRGVVYMKLASLNKKGEEQFKVVTFNSNGLKQYDEVFVSEDGKWYSTIVTGATPFPADAHLESVATPVYSLSDSFKTGSVVIDGQGNVVGFVTDRNAIVALPNEDYFLNGIEEKTVITYPSLGLEGWYNDEKILVLNEEKVVGFLVTKVLGNKNFFQRGDVLFEVNGRPAERANVWYTINNGTKVRVSVWRGGKIVEGQVPVIEL